MIQVKSLLTKMFDIMDVQFSHPYILMNKYDEVPYKLPSDLDMCITPEDFNRLDNIMSHIAKGIGLAVVQKIWHGYQKCAYILSPLEPEGRFRLQLDYFTDFSVRHTPLLISYRDMQQETRKYGRFSVPSYRMEYVFLLMRRVFKNDFDEEHLKAISLAMNGDKDGAFIFLRNYFDIETAEKINKYVENADILALQEMQPLLWKKMQELSKKNSAGVYRIKFHLHELKRKLYRIKYPVGYSAVLLSPDGGGKSTVFERLQDTCWGCFHGITKMYFRPHILTNPGSLNPINPVPESADNPDPHGKKPNGLFKSLFRYFYYNIDFILGYNTLVRKKRIQKQLVIFDRYYYDYFVDLTRYRYSFPKWVPKAFAWSIPTPDVIFVLEGTPEVLHKRKQELTVEELTRQTEEYHKISLKYKNAVIINVDNSLDDVVRQITKEILYRKALRTAKGMNIQIGSDGLPIIKENK